MQGDEGGVDGESVVAVGSVARCACCHFSYGQWVDFTRPSQSYPGIVARFRRLIRGYEVHCHECRISPICQMCTHRGHACAPEDFLVSRLLCCLCLRRRYPHMTACSMADWHVGRPDMSGALTPGLPAWAPQGEASVHHGEGSLAGLEASTAGDYRPTGGDGGHLCSYTPSWNAEMSGSVTPGTDSDPPLQGSAGLPSSRGSD